MIVLALLTMAGAARGDVYGAITSRVAAAVAENAAGQARLADRCSLADYAGLVRRVNGTNVWTAALQRALDEHQVVTFPPRAEPYFFDGTVVVPSHRRLEATGATIRLVDGTRTILLRNRNTQDGTLAPIPAGTRDAHIAVVGGRWEDCCTRRRGYGSSGMYNLQPRRHGNFFGVSTLFFFNNCDHLSVTDATFHHTGGFAVQCGDGDALRFENITFDRCFADGLHLNGNLSRVLARNVRGQVGDDLVALNAYDWLNSSVNFGPQRDILCEDLELVRRPGEAAYPAIRIQPAKYRYADGSKVDCAIERVIFRRVKGITTFKMYLQTPRYAIGTEPEWSEVGSGGDLFFEDIAIDLDRPIDCMGQYAASEPLRGHFGAFEFGANLSSVHFRNLDVTFHLDKYPLSHLAVVGPKSCFFPNQGGPRGLEIFDPYVSCTVGRVTVEGLRVHGAAPRELVRATVFDNVNGDGRSSGRGEIRELKLPASPAGTADGHEAAEAERAFRAQAAQRIAAIRATPGRAVPAGAPAYYLSAKSGDDAADGRTPKTAWRTAARLEREKLAPGSFVLFERGGVYRGTVRASAGVTYTAYGTGPKPCVYGSPEDGADPAKWQRTENPRVWAYDIGHRDVGTLVFDGGVRHATKIVIRTDRKTGATFNKFTGRPFNSYRDLDGDLHFWHDYYEKGTGRLYLYSERNPGERFRSIEFNVKCSGFSVGRACGVTIDNFTVKYVGVHGVSAGTCTNLTVSNCEFGWIGGSIQAEAIFGRDYPTRLGNAVEIYGGCENYAVTNCYAWQVYDAGVTQQFNIPASAGAKRFDQKNVLYAGNVFEKCNYSVEYFLTARKGNWSRMENVRIEDNLMFDAGVGFCEQRPDRNEGAHIKAWYHGERNRAKNYVVRRNVFCGAGDMLVQICAGLRNEDGSSSLPTLSENVFIGRAGGQFGQITETGGPRLVYGPDTQTFVDRFGPGNRCLLLAP